MNLKPTSNKVFLESVEERITKGGLIVSVDIQEEYIQTKVVAAGPGRLGDGGNLIPMRLKAGDRVIVAKFSLRSVDVDGVKYLVGFEDDVIAVIEDGTKS